MALALLLASNLCFAGEDGRGEGQAEANYVKLDPLVVNLAADSYVSFTPELKLADPLDKEFVKAYTPVVRFELIKLMMGNEAAQVQTPAFINRFAAAAAESANKAIGAGYIKGVFFADWTVQ